MSGGATHTFWIIPKTTAERNTMVTLWGTAQKGRMWYNSDTKQLEGWDGSAVVILG
jgi:hypothetical protein